MFNRKPQALYVRTKDGTLYLEITNPRLLGEILSSLPGSWVTKKFESKVPGGPQRTKECFVIDEDRTMEVGGMCVYFWAGGYLHLGVI